MLVHDTSPTMTVFRFRSARQNDARNKIAHILHRWTERSLPSPYAHTRARGSDGTRGRHSVRGQRPQRHCERRFGRLGGRKQPFRSGPLESGSSENVTLWPNGCATPHRQDERRRPDTYSDERMAGAESCLTSGLQQSNAARCGHHVERRRVRQPLAWRFSFSALTAASRLA